MSHRRGQRPDSVGRLRRRGRRRADRRRAGAADGRRAKRLRGQPRLPLRPDGRDAGRVRRSPAGLTYAPPRIPIVSNLTGDRRLGQPRRRLLGAARPRGRPLPRRRPRPGRPGCHRVPRARPGRRAHRAGPGRACPPRSRSTPSWSPHCARDRSELHRRRRGGGRPARRRRADRLVDSAARHRDRADCPPTRSSAAGSGSPPAPAGGTAADPSDDPFWSAVEHDDLETLGTMLGDARVGEVAPALPVLADWHRGRPGPWLRRPLAVPGLAGTGRHARDRSADRDLAGRSPGPVDAYARTVIEALTEAGARTRPWCWTAATARRSSPNWPRPTRSPASCRCSPWTTGSSRPPAGAQRAGRDPGPDPGGRRRPPRRAAVGASPGVPSSAHRRGHRPRAERRVGPRPGRRPGTHRPLGRSGRPARNASTAPRSAGARPTAARTRWPCATPARSSAAWSAHHCRPPQRPRGHRAAPS